MIDLPFHDLRHEGGIRLLEKGWQLHWLQQMYGHATLARSSNDLHADEFVLPKRGAIVVQAELEHPRRLL